MYYIILLYLLLITVVSTIAPLRKHHYNIQSAIDESEVITPQQQTNKNISNLYSYHDESICGEASISCMAFGYTSSIPVRCGILKKAPVCKRIDPTTKKIKCDAFCDTDGSGRLCQRAFPQCCKKSINGCISSKPRNIQLYNNKK